MTEFSCTAGFWSDFIERHWERQPLVIEQPLSRPLLTPAEVFEALVRASDQYRAGERLLPVRFYIEATQLATDVGQYLPESADGGWASYVERVTAQVEGRRFGLVVNNYQAYDARLWQRLRAFLRPLYELIGLPGEGSDAVIFLGNYQKTPFGVHQDPVSNFTFVLAGQKRIRAWPDEFFRAQKGVPNSLAYEPFGEAASVLTGRPGDILYWPSGCWHVGDCVDEFTISLNVGFSFDARPAWFLKQVTDQLERRLAASAWAEAPLKPERLPASAETRAELLAAASAALHDVSQTAALAQTVTAAWLNRLTGYGFKATPPPLPWRSLADDEVVCGDPADPLRWLPLDDDELICSAHGRAFTIPAHPALLRLLERLNSGAAYSVRDLIEQHAGNVRVDEIEFEAEPEEVRTLLEKLCSLRALTARSAEFSRAPLDGARAQGSGTAPPGFNASRAAARQP